MTTVRCSICNTDREINSFARGRRGTYRRNGVRYCYACDDCASRIEEEHADYDNTREFQNVIITRDGFVFRKLRNHEGKWHIGYLINLGYVMVRVGNKTVYAHRLVYELFSDGEIPKTDDANRPLVIAHRDDNKCNNAFDNLHLITQSQNTKDAYDTGARDRTRIPKRAVIATNTVTAEILRYSSANKAAIALNIHRSSILLACNGTTKSAISKTTGAKYSFSFTN